MRHYRATIASYEQTRQADEPEPVGHDGAASVATLIRSLHKVHIDNPDEAAIVGQIDNLRSRIRLIKHMQVLAVSSFVFYVLSMFLFFSELLVLANYSFGVSLLLLEVSLLFSL